MVDHITGNATFKIIEILISPTGETTVQTKGFAGAECQQASEFLEKALGQKTSERLTGEFYQQQVQQQELRQGG
jgi:hypothetical protein